MSEGARPICGWCFDGLCQDHTTDCSFFGWPIPCFCPNLKEPEVADLEFAVAKRRTKPITFTLGGEMRISPAVEADEEAGVEAQPEVRGEDDHEYSFTPPKSALMLMPILDGGDISDGMGMTKATLNWLGEGLTEEENQRILARLKDNKDDLDVDNLTDVIKALSEKVGGRPTG